MSSNTSQSTSSLMTNPQLNQARIQGDQTQSICLFTTSSKKSRYSNKSLPPQQDRFNFRESLSQIIDRLQNEESLTTPRADKENKRVVDLTKTMTIKGKKGKLYEQICPVCLGEYNYPLGSLSCKHKFCFQCLQVWSKTSTNCPCCRKKFNLIIKTSKQQKIQKIHVEQKQANFREEDYFICYVCNRGDNEHVLLICDNCDFNCCHIFCDPTLNNTIPEGDWFCRNCQHIVEATQISNLSSITSVQSQSQQQQDKPVAARTRSSRNFTSQAHIFQRMRRRR